MSVTDGNDSLATISEGHLIDVIVTSSSALLGSVDSGRIQKEKGGPHAPWTRIIPGSANLTREEEDFIEEPIVFSDKKISSEPLSQIIAAHDGPKISGHALNQLQRKPGHVPIGSLFHEESYRTRLDDTDDEDLEFIANRKRKKVATSTQTRGKSFSYDMIFWEKGEFIFPYRTFRPKVQVPLDVASGITPQGIIAERLHRIYRRIDLHTTLEKLGVEYVDLLPPPNYGEHNSRFLQESMWRNRSRISGTEKRTFIYGQDPTGDDVTVEKHSDGSQGSSDSGSSGGSSVVDARIDEVAAEAKAAHLKTKSQFGFYFPLEYFDNEDFDIRSAEDWISLRDNPKGVGMYPLPGKAYIPTPFDRPETMLSLAEITSDVLLDKSMRLQAFRKWLIRERYQRLAQDIKVTDDDLEMSPLMQMGTTIKTLIKKSVVAIRPSMFGHAGRQLPNSGTSDALDQLALENEGESEAAMSSLSSSTQLSDDFLSQFSKGHLTGGDGGTDVDAKRSESILSDVWSDPNSLQYLFGPPGKEEVLGEVSKVDDALEQLRQIRASMMLRSLPSKAVRISDNSSVSDGLESPDLDPYDQSGSGFDLIYDYNKMKTVHNYNWKWVDVAVFEYDFGKNRYLVRTILEPFIFAWVPKVYLCMNAEDPSVHAARIKDAAERRTNFENQLRYNLYVDCLSVESAPTIPDAWMVKAVDWVASTPRFAKPEKVFNMIKKEVNLDYSRVHMNLLFDHITNGHSKHYKAWIYDEDYYRLHSEPGADWFLFQTIVQECRTGVFAFKKFRLEQSSVIYTAEPCAAFSEILVASVVARSRPLILTGLEAPVPLHVYMARQLEQMGETHEYMKTQWLNFVINAIITQLEKVPHSWYSMDENEWAIFEVSKMSKYLKLVKFLMQDTLRYMVLESLTSYLDEIRDLTATLTKPETGGEGERELDDDGGSKLETRDERQLTPIWILDLSLTPLGPTYNHYLRDFPASVIKIIHTCVESVSGIPDITPLIMKNLLHGIKKPLFPVAKDEPQITIIVQELKELMKKALVPVDVYAQSYKRYMPVYHLNLEKFMQEWNSIDHNSKEIRATLEFHIRHYAEIESEIPTEIDIGAIRINVATLRKELLERKKLLYTSILDSFATKLGKLIKGILQEYEEIEAKLSKRSNDIEEVMELKHYLAGLPSLISRYDELIQIAMKDYELFERFKYRISNEDFEAKWLAMIGLRRMYKLAEKAVAWLGSDYKRLLNMQKADLSYLSQTVNNTIDSVQSLAEFVDEDQFPEVKERIEEVERVVKALEEENELVNRRQTLFGLPPVQKDILARIIEEMHRYKSLWITIGDWLKIKEDAYSQPLETLDIPGITLVFTEGLKVMRRSLKMPKIQELAKKVKREMDALRKLVPLVNTFTNLGLRPRHLEAISEICGFPVTEAGSYTLMELVDQGAGQHLDKIAEIGDTAGHELNIELELNGIEEGGHELKVTLSKDQKTGIESVVLPKRTDSFMERATRTVGELQQNPYRAPFAAQLDVLEKRLRAAVETLKEIKTIGPVWFELQPTFEVPDAAVKMPAEFKLFAKMNRIWRRMIRIIRVTTGVLDFAADRTLRASIAQFGELNSNVQELLEERNRPKDSDSDDD